MRCWPSSRPSAARGCARPASPTRRRPWSAAPTCAWSARCTRSPCRCRDGPLGAASLAAIRADFRRGLHRRYTSLLRARRHRGGVVPRARASARRRSSPSARRRAEAGRGAQGPSPRLFRRWLPRGRRLRPLRARARRTASPAPPSSRSARRPPSSRPATRSSSTPVATSASRSPPATRAVETVDRHGVRSSGSATHRGGPDRPGDHVEPADQRSPRRCGDGLPHRLLADHLGGAGFRLRATRRERQHARPLAARDAGLQPDPAARVQGAAEDLSARDACGRATCWSPTIRGSAPGTSSTSRS